MDDVERFEYATQRDPQIRGLVLMPFAVLFLLSALWQLGLYPLPWDDQPHVPGRWFMIGSAVALLVAYIISRWYVARYGTINQNWAHSQVIPILAVGACLPIAVSIAGNVNISVAPATVALVLAGVGIHHFPLRAHYLAAGAVLLAFALLRTFGMENGTAHTILFNLTVSAVLTIVGIGDHRLYVSSCHEVPALV